VSTSSKSEARAPLVEPTLSLADALERVEARLAELMRSREPLLTDISTELVYPLIPLYLTALGAPPAILGLIEGIAESTASACSEANVLARNVGTVHDRALPRTVERRNSRRVLRVNSVFMD
jgi:hypothetical protein